MKLSLVVYMQFKLPIVIIIIIIIIIIISGSDVSQDTLLLHGPFARKPKRIRTAFSPSQLLRLERAFEKNHYVVGAERKQLANSLSLSETQVNISSARTQQIFCCSHAHRKSI